MASASVITAPRRRSDAQAKPHLRRQPCQGRGAYLLLDLLELILTHTAQGANPVVGYILESRSCGDTTFGIAHSGIINPIANCTSVLVHNSISLKVIVTVALATLHTVQN